MMGNHYVPREYLRAFAADGNSYTLWMFDKSTMEFCEHPVAIGKVAQQRGYYSSDDEVALNNLVEGPGNLVLKKLRKDTDLLARDLSQEERADFSIYLATMMSRVPHKRTKAEAIVPKAVDSAVDNFKEEYSQFSWKFGITSIEREMAYDEVERIRVRLKDSAPSEVAELIESPWPTTRWIEAIYNSNWYFVTATEADRFVTSDNPFFYFGCYGIGSEKAEFTFPISSRRALFGTNLPCRENRNSKSMTFLVRESNRRLISASTRFVFSPKKYDWIKTVASKKKPFLSRILPDGVSC